MSTPRPSLADWTDESRRLRESAKAVAIAAPELLARLEHIAFLCGFVDSHSQVAAIPEVADLVTSLRRLNAAIHWTAEEKRQLARDWEARWR